MALGVPGFVRIGAAIAGCALVAACTPEPGPTVTPTPAPSVTASPTPSATPTETEIERQQRSDFEAAVEAYRANISERDRQAQLGIARSTAALQKTSQGEYLEFSLGGLKDIKNRGWRTVGSVVIVGVTSGGWQEHRVRLIACEDGSKIKVVDKEGRDVTPKARIRTFVQTYTANYAGSSWKLSKLESKRVRTFAGAPCGG